MLGKAKESFGKRFRMRDLGKSQTMLGMKISGKLDKFVLDFLQEMYVLEDSGMLWNERC